MVSSHFKYFALEFKHSMNHFNQFIVELTIDHIIDEYLRMSMMIDYHGRVGKL